MKKRNSVFKNKVISKLNRCFFFSLELILLVFLFLGNTSTAYSQDKKKIDYENCIFKGFPLHGKIKFVDSFPDFTVKIVDSFPDLKVKFVNSFPNKCGEWQIVESFPDVKIKIVDSFPDLTIKFVESFPGKP